MVGPWLTLRQPKLHSLLVKLVMQYTAYAARNRHLGRSRRLPNQFIQNGVKRRMAIAIYGRLIDHTAGTWQLLLCKGYQNRNM